MSDLTPMRESPSPRFQWWRWVLVALLLLAFFLRVHRLGDQRVWWDEGWSVWVSRFATSGILSTTGNDVHPPLYFWLLHLWRSLSGDSEFGLRLLSSFFGTLTVAATFALGRDIGRRYASASPAVIVGLLGALFLAVSRFAIAWSQEIRMYALASLLAVVAVWAARRIWDQDRTADRIAYVAATTAGLYTLYLFAPVWAAVNLAWLWVWWNSPDRRRALLRWVILQLIIVTFFLPWAIYASGGFLSTAAATPIQVLDFLHIYWTVLALGIPLDVAQYNAATMPALAVFGLAVAALVWASWRHLRAKTTTPANGPADSRWRMARDLTLLLVILLLPAVIVYFVSLPRQNFYNPPFSPRYLVIFTSFYSILLAWGLVVFGRTPLGKRTGSPSIAPVVAVVMAGYMLLVTYTGLQPYYPGRVLVDDYPSLVTTIDAYRQADDAVVLYSDTDWPIFAYHHPNAWQGVPHLWDVSPEQAADFLRPIWDEHEAVWLVTTPYSTATDSQRLIPGWLDDRATAVREFTYKDMALTLYTRTAARAESADQVAPDAPAPDALEATLSDGYMLGGYAQAAHDFKSGDTVHLFVYGQGPDGVTTDFGFIDAENQIWQPTAVALNGGEGTQRTQVDLVVPPEAPDGAYQFYVLDAGGSTVPFGSLNITQKESEFLTTADVTIDNPLGIPFADGIRLEGYDASANAQPGGTVNLTLYWTSDGDIRQRYKVFTHLLGETFNAATGNFLWGQVDNEPAHNSRPTTTWRGAEIIVDEYAIPVAPDAPPGTYQLEIGLYDAVSGERLPVLGEGSLPTADHVILGTVEITP